MILLVRCSTSRDSAILTVCHADPDPDPEASVVFSIDFTPAVASTTVTQTETLGDGVE